MVFVGFLSYRTFSQSVITKHLEFGNHNVGYWGIHTYDNVMLLAMRALIQAQSILQILKLSLKSMTDDPNILYAI